jgi:hypothetical protein
MYLQHGDRRLLEYDLEANDDEGGGRSHGNRRRDDYHSDWERKAPSKIIYIQGLRLETDEETVSASCFSLSLLRIGHLVLVIYPLNSFPLQLTDRLKVFGAVEEARLWKGDTKRGTIQGFAFVEFENLNDAIEFMSFHQNQNANNNNNNNDEGVVSMELDGAQVTLEYRRDMGSVSGSSGGGKGNTRSLLFSFPSFFCLGSQCFLCLFFQFD